MEGTLRIKAHLKSRLVRRQTRLMSDDHLTIGEMAARAGVATSALRFYEANGLIRSDRTDSGHRRFAREVLRRIAFIQVAQRVGLSLDEIKDALSSLPDSRTPTAADWAHVSSAWRARLNEQIESLERFRDELTSCIGCGCLSLRVCTLYNPGDRAGNRGPGPRYLLGDRPDV